MKAKHLFFALFALSLSVAACEDSFENEVQPDEPRTFTVKLRATGEVDVTYEPLTRFTPDDRDLYGVQVRHKPATTGSYEHYAYGLFDNLDDVELEVKENYMYNIEIELIDDGKDKIYCDSILVDNNYYLGYGNPFRAYNKYNGSTQLSITKLTNEFTYASDRYFSGSGIQTIDGKYYQNPEGIDFYYGRISDYIPTEDGTTLSIYLKHMIIGLKINIGDYFDNGTITLPLFDKTFTFTPENRTLETTFAHYGNGVYTGYKNWYTKEDITNSRTDVVRFDFQWVKDNGTIVDWKPYDVYFYRLKQTVFNLEYYGEDGVLGNNTFEAHYEDTELEKDYVTYNFGSEQDDYNW